MNKNNLKQRLKRQSENFESAVQKKMLYFLEGEEKYFSLDEKVWDEKPKKDSQNFDFYFQADDNDNVEVVEKGKLAYSPISYQDRLSILQNNSEIDVYKKKI